MRISARIGLLTYCLAGFVHAQVSDPNGRINAVNGAVFLDGKAISSPGARVGAGSEIGTGRGMAEILLTPGNFLRAGNRSRVFVESISAHQATIRVQSGTVILESLASPVTLQVEQGAVQSIPRGPGLFEFDQSRNAVIAFSGRADIRKGGIEIALEAGNKANTHNLKTEKIIAGNTGALYAWTSYRSEQLSSESAAVQPADVPRADAGKASWVKMPWSDSYTFISVSGYVNSPFGWPFFAPGHSHNYIPFVGSGDSYLYGPPMTPLPSPTISVPAPNETTHPTVPLTAPGVPSFPRNK